MATEEQVLVRVNWDAVRGEEWAFTEPPALVPIPAAQVRRLTGAGLIAHDPVLRGWNYEFVAASEPHDHHGEPHVGILSAADWHRRRADPTYLAVPRPMPLDRLWVEARVEAPDTELVPALVELEVAVPHLSPAVG